MAFTFTVEDGSGVPGANSYVSVEDADDILTLNIHASGGWEALTVDQRQRLLAFASYYLDDRTRWFGKRVSEASGLRWPREGVQDRDGHAIDKDEIPAQLRRATAQMARYFIAEDRTAERDQDALKSVRADVVELEFVEGYRLPKVPEHMRFLVEGLGTIRGTGSTFGRIIR